MSSPAHSMFHHIYLYVRNFLRRHIRFNDISPDDYIFVERGHIHVIIYTRQGGGATNAVASSLITIAQTREVESLYRGLAL